MEAVRQSDSCPTCAKPIVTVSRLLRSSLFRLPLRCLLSDLQQLHHLFFAAASLDAPALPVDVFALFPHPANIVAPNAIHITILTNFLFISKTSHSFFRFGFVANHGLIITVRGFYEYRIKFELSIIFY